MTPEELVAYWLATADESLQSARNLFDKNDFVSALFFGHLYLEKLLKALIVHKTRAPAPYGHDLYKLTDKTGLALTSVQVEFLKRVTEYNIEGRYPDYKRELKHRATGEFCESELNEIERFGEWIQTLLRH